MRLKLITPPTAEPLTLLEAAQHLKLADTQVQADGLEDKALVQALIQATREAVENYTNRQLMEATYELVCDDLENVTLPKAPFKAIVSIHYTNNQDVLTLLPAANYTVLDGGEPAVILVKKPSDYKKTLNGVKIRFTAGYVKEETTTDNLGNTTTTKVPIVPESLKAAMKLLIGHLYENREEVTIGTVSYAKALPKSSEYLMNPYRVFQF